MSQQRLNSVPQQDPLHESAPGARPSRRAVLLASLGLFQGAWGQRAPRLQAGETFPTFPAGVASGDVAHDRAVLWTRIQEPAQLKVEVARDAGFRNVVFEETLPALPENDFSAKVVAASLDPGQTYYYRWRRGNRASEVGTFRTPPHPRVPAGAVRFAFTGDSDGSRLGGEPFFNRFEVLEAIRAEGVDAFFYIGDTIYSDLRGGGLPPALGLDEKRALYRLNRGYPALRELMRSTATYAIWDNHEVIDHFDAATDPALRAAGRKAFLEYMPVEESRLPPGNDGADAPLFRVFSWGRDVELFILDLRSRRSPQAGDFPPDDLAPTLPAPIRAAFSAFFPSPPPPELLAALEDPSRTLMGEAQKSLFKQALLKSKARFKIVLNPSPIQQLWLNPYDRWEGYAAERAEILAFIREHDIRNVVFLTTSDHRNLIARVFLDRFAAPETIAHEFMTGPIAHYTDQARLLRLFGPVVGPQAIAGQHALFNILGVECRHLNACSYGLVEIDPAAGTLTVTLKDQHGAVLRDQLNPALPCVKTLHAV